MGELHDFGRARREKDSKRGSGPGAVDKLADALGLRGDKPSGVTADDLERVASSPEIEPDVRNTARQISDLLHGRAHEVVKEQEAKEEQ